MCIHFLVFMVRTTSCLLIAWGSQEFRGFKVSCERFWFSTKKIFFWRVEANANVSCQVPPCLSATTHRLQAFILPIRARMILGSYGSLFPPSGISDVKRRGHINHARSIEPEVFQHLSPHASPRFAIQILACSGVNTDR